MRIGLDYDNTYSADPRLWRKFIDAARDYGHDVRIVTARDDRFDRTVDMVNLERWCQVVYTRGTAKRWFCQRFCDDFVPDIWIDDLPESILGNSTTSTEDLAQWRATRADGAHMGEKNGVQK